METAARVSIYCSFVVAIVWSIYAIVLVDVFVILLMVWIGLQACLLRLQTMAIKNVSHRRTAQAIPLVQSYHRQFCLGCGWILTCIRSC